MDFGPDDRAQAIQVGAVLLFAMLIIAMSVYQAEVVPRENAEIEFNNYLDASSDMTVLRNDIMGTAASDSQRGITITTGTTYPARVFFVNPGPATGSVRTGDPANISIANVKSPSDNQNVDRYLQSESAELEYSTRDVEFDPSYNEIGDEVAPVVVANGFTYRNYSSPVALTTQTIIKQNRLTFVTVDGDLDASGVQTPLTATPVSAHTRTITVTNRTSDPVNITIPTPISAETWENEILAGQMDPGENITDRYVTDVSAGPRPNTVNVTLEPGANYELRVGRIELHEKSDVSDASPPDARYLVAESDRNVTTKKGRVKLTVEARDRFNNPVSNAVVNFTGQGEDFETQAGTDLSMPIRTDENGQATVWYNATGIVGNIPVTAHLNSTEPTASEKKVRFTVTNTYTGTSGSGDGESNINPGRFVVLEGASVEKVNGQDRVRVTLNNTGQTDANITAMRFSFYFEDSTNRYVAETDVYNSSQPNDVLATLPIQGEFKTITPVETIEEGTTYQLDFSFRDDKGNTWKPQTNKDFFVVEVVYNDASVATYFIAF